MIHAATVCCWLMWPDADGTHSKRSQKGNILEEIFNSTNVFRSSKFNVFSFVFFFILDFICRTVIWKIICENETKTISKMLGHRQNEQRTKLLEMIMKLFEMLAEIVECGLDRMGLFRSK